MTTISILLFGALGFVIFVADEFVLWLLEVIFATAKFILCYLVNRPCSWRQSYLGIRIIFTWVLKWVSFAELTAAQRYKHRHGIQRYMQTLVAKQDQRKEKLMEHFHHKNQIKKSTKVQK